MPLVKGCDRDKIRPGFQCCTQRGFVVFAIDAVSSVLEIPGSNARVDISRAYTWNEHQVVIFTESFYRGPVTLRGTVGKTISGKVGVNAVEPCCQDISLVFLLHQQRDEDGVILGIPDAVGLRVL